jgi:hypothetical protein
MRFGNGLYLLVSPAGTKSWQVRYHDAAGRHQAKILGHWPAMTLEEAERKRDIIQYYKPQIDPQRMRAAAAADRALIQAFTRWKPSTRERRFLDEVFMRAFAAWRATR